MFAKISSVVVVALAAFAAAAPQGDHVSSSVDCNAGETYCCNQIQTPGNYNDDVIKALLALHVPDLTGQAGIQCSPVAAGIAVATGGKCQTNTVCCKDFHSATLVGLNCNNVGGQA